MSGNVRGTEKLGEWGEGWECEGRRVFGPRRVRGMGEMSGNVRGKDLTRRFNNLGSRKRRGMGR